MKQYQYLAAVLLAMGLILASGVYVGKMSNRWGPSQDSLAAAEKLESFPEEFGKWKLQSSAEMSEAEINELQPGGYISRVYAIPESGERVSVMVVIGPSGPISLHTPTANLGGCLYGYKEVEPPMATAVGDSGDQFWKATYAENTLDANLVRVYYGWTPGNHWAATGKYRRWSLAGYPYLYKIQVMSHHPAGTDLTSNDPCKHFLEDFIPEIEKNLIDCSDSR